MNIAHAGVAAALAVMTASSGVLWSPAGVDPVTVSAIGAAVPAEERFLLRAGGRDEGCLVTAASTGGEKRPLSLAPACLGLVPGLAGAEMWLERADGSIAFARSGGEVVAEFAVADGAAFESYAPRQPIMTLLSR